MMLKTLTKTAFMAAWVSRPCSRGHLTAVTALSMPSSSAAAGDSSACSALLGFDYPELVVFDLDACLWDKEMFEMPAIPTPDRVVRGDLNGRGEGVTGVYSGSRQVISLHKGSLIALQEHADNRYPGLKIALASSADTPFAEQIGRASLKLLEVLPGMTICDLLMRDWDGKDINQIGRQPPLSSNKAKSHFPLLRELTKVRYDKMLFFDDCNWGDHCGMVEAACKEKDSGESVTTYRTPNGLRETEWRGGMERYAKLH